MVQDLAQAWLDAPIRSHSLLPRVAGGVTAVVAVLLVVLAAGATGALRHLNKNPDAVPDFATRRKVQSACALSIVASVAGLVYLGPGR